MTDMEMAKELLKKWDSFLYPQMYPVALVKDFIRKAFFAGLEAGRPKWHKIADGDLPEEGEEVLNEDGVKVMLINGHWRYVIGGEWEDDACLNHWCKIPTFPEE